MKKILLLFVISLLLIQVNAQIDVEKLDSIDLVYFYKNVLDSNIVSKKDSLTEKIDSISKITENDSTKIASVLSDSVINKTYNNVKGAITNDTIKSVLLKLSTLQGNVDTVIANKTSVSEDTLIKNDSILIIKNTIQKERIDSILTFSDDSVIYSKVDSSHYIIQNLRRQMKIEKDDNILNDTVYQAIDRLIKYHESFSVQDVAKYLENNLSGNSFLFRNNDSLTVMLNDSIVKEVSLLLSEIKEGRMKVSVSNSVNDSVFFYVNNSINDSVRINIYDNRNEFANIWLKNKGDKNLDISFEDGIYIDRPKYRKTVNREIEHNRKQVKLKKIRKSNIIVPIWKIGGYTTFKFNQGYLSNWVQGGESSLSGLSISKYNINYVYGKKSWDNDIEYRYGLIRAGENSIRKNDDKLEINSKFGQEAYKNWYYSLLFNFKSQLFKGYDYPNDSVAVSGFLAPGYVVFSFGLDYKPNKNFTVLISPITSKFTIVRDTVKYDQTKYGLSEDEKIRKEIGAYIKAQYKVKIMDNIVMENKVNFFTNYSQNPKNVDVDWELSIEMKVNEFISASLITHFIYDDDIDIPVFSTVNSQRTQIGVTKNAQFKEMIGVGFLYKF